MSYVAHNDQTASIGWKGMLSQLGINFALGAGTLILFSILRPRNKIVYAPKIKYSSEKKQPPEINQGLFSWVKPVLTATEPILMEKIGLDAVVFIRFIKLCRDMFFTLSILGLAVMAVNVWRTIHDIGSPPSTDNPLQVLSISYLSDYTWLWVHVIATWLFSFLVYYFLYDQYAGFKGLKRNFFQSEEYQNSLHARTLLVIGVPPSMQSDQGLEKYLNSLKIGRPISQAHIGRKVDDLAELIEKHDKTVRKLESVLAGYLRDPDNLPANRPTRRVGGICGRKVDSINYYTDQIETLEEEIARTRERVSEFKPTNYGFVSFPTIRDAHSVAKKFEGVHHGPKIMPAPQPKDIIWNNLTMPSAVRETKKLIGHGLFTAFCFLWFIPLGMLSSAAQIDHIVRIAPWTAKVLYYNDFVTGLFEAWMTPLIMALFFLLLPVMLEFLSKQQGKITKSSLSRAVLAKLFLFFLINSLIFYTLSSTFIQVWGDIKAQINEGNTNVNNIYSSVKKTQLVDQIATSLISVSLFWINYISLRGVGTLLDLAQVAALVLTFLHKRFLHPTPRNLKEFTRPPTFDYANYYNLHLFFFTIGMLYSVIAPLILVVCFLYFSLANLVYRYQLMYVFTTKIETGGSFWRVIFNRFIVSTLFWQIVMIGVMNLKGAHVQSVAVVPLPFLTIAFKLMCARKFDTSVRYYLGDNSNEAYVGSNQNDRVDTRFGDPSLSQELMTPMVFSNVKHLLPRVYKGRIDEGTIRRRGTIRPVSTIFNSGRELKIQSVNIDELEIDEDTLEDEQNPGYYNEDFKDQNTEYHLDTKEYSTRNMYQETMPLTTMSSKESLSRDPPAYQ